MHSASSSFMRIILSFVLAVSMMPLLDVTPAYADESVQTASDVAAEGAGAPTVEETVAPEAPDVTVAEGATLALEAQDTQNVEEDAELVPQDADWEECGGCEWRIKDGVLTVRPLPGNATGTLSDWGKECSPWTGVFITGAVFEPGVKASTCCKMFTTSWLLETVDLSGLDTSNVTDMSDMFSSCWMELTTLDLSRLDTSNVTDMSNMFDDCRALTTLDLSGFDTSNVTDMSSMFGGCERLTALDTSDFDTSSVTDLSSMFWGCERLTTLDTSGFDTSNVTDTSGMFYKCSSLTTLDTSGFDTSNVTDMGRMFSWCSSLTTLDLSGWNVSNVTDMGDMFSSCSSLTTLDLSGWNVSSVTDMSDMFSWCSSLTTLDLSSLKASSVTNMYNMFDGCSLLTALDLSGFDTSKVTDMRYMFSFCDAIAEFKVGTGYKACSIDGIPVGIADGQWLSTTQNAVVTSEDIFNRPNTADVYYVPSASANWTRCGGCEWQIVDKKLTVRPLPGFETGPLSNWGNQSPWGGRDIISAAFKPGVKASTCEVMFSDCSSLTSLDLSGLDTSKAESMFRMFSGCPKLTALDLSNFGTSQVRYMDYMFEGCWFLATLDLSSFDTSKVTNMKDMFNGCGALSEFKVGTGYKALSAQGIPTGALYGQWWSTAQGKQMTCEDILNRPNVADTYLATTGFDDVNNEIMSNQGADKVWYVNDGWLSYVINNGLMSGYASSKNFGPYDNITRGQVAVILYRYADGKSYGSTTDGAGYPSNTVFSDEESHVYYTAAINWAKDAGVMTGDAATGFTTVRPNDPVTREELCLMLYRFANARGAGANGTVDGSGILGMDSVSSWARVGVDWAVSNGVIGGVNNGNGTYSMKPQDTTWRSSMAKMITVTARDVLKS